MKYNLEINENIFRNKWKYNLETNENMMLFINVYVEMNTSKGWV